MGLTMGQRKALTREMAARYRGASRPQKKAMLDEFVELHGCTRHPCGRAWPEVLAVGLAHAAIGDVAAPWRRGPTMPPASSVTGDSAWPRQRAHFTTGSSQW